jgi:catalase
MTGHDTTTQSAPPVASDAHSVSLGPDGAIALHDRYLVEKLAQIEQAGSSPANTVPGIDISLDKMQPGRTRPPRVQVTGRSCLRAEFLRRTGRRPGQGGTWLLGGRR